MSLCSINPDSISEESEQWNATAEGLLRRVLWQIETRQIKPKELIVIYLDYTGGMKREISVETTKHDIIKIDGILSLAMQRRGDISLYGENDG